MSERTSVTIGVFDGVHRGQCALLARARLDADRHRRRCLAVTFDPHPLSIVGGGRPAPCSLTSLADRITLLGAAGADEVAVLPFTAARAGQPAAEFVEEYLRTGLGMAHLVVGHDFRFGAGAAGDAALLARLGPSLDFTVEQVPPVRSAALPAPGIISATAIRHALAAGEVGLAQVLLGRPYSLGGPVIRGDQRGRLLGYPTANIDVVPGHCWPADGVYAVRLQVGERSAGPLGPLPGEPPGMAGVASVGANVTFGGQERRLEVHVLDRTGLDLYGCPARVDFHARLRGMLTFTDPAELVAAMASDVAQARVVLEPGAHAT